MNIKKYPSRLRSEKSCDTPKFHLRCVGVESNFLRHFGWFVLPSKLAPGQQTHARYGVYMYTVHEYCHWRCDRRFACLRFSSICWPNTATHGCVGCKIKLSKSHTRIGSSTQKYTLHFYKRLVCESSIICPINKYSPSTERAKAFKRTFCVTFAPIHLFDW